MITISYEDFKSKYGTVKRIEDYHPRETSYDILATLVNYYKPKNILEIGTQFGGGTIILYLYSGGHVWTIDIPREFFPDLSSEIADQNDSMKFVEIGREFVKHPELLEYITQIYGDSQTFNFSQIDLPMMDFVFIDGNHTTETVLKDTQQALRWLKKGGILFWHDIQIPAVKAGIECFDNVLNIITVDEQNATFAIRW
jgi:predicted O-methyltransferase YrrM